MAAVISNVRATVPARIARRAGQPGPGARREAMELVILVGVPASGKSSFVRARLAATHQHVSQDLQPPARRGNARQRELVAAALRAGRSVVVDNVNATAAIRAPLIRLGREHGARIIGYFFPTAVAEAVARNRQRIAAERVPGVAIYAAAKRLQPPAPAEGFDEVWEVRLGPDGGFDVTAAPPVGG
jgi:predicted kinase